MDEVYGAYAKVLIKFESDLQELGTLLEKEGITPQFFYETDMDEPHELVGYVDAFGFSGSLRELENPEKEMWSGYKYMFELDSTDTHAELFSNHMYNISHWLARFISIYGVTTMALNSDNETGQSFTKNPITYERKMVVVKAISAKK